MSYDNDLALYEWLASHGMTVQRHFFVILCNTRTSLGQLHQVLNPPSFGRQYDFRVRLLIFSFMAPLVSSYRYGGDEVDLHLAKADSKILHEKIPDKAYSDDEVMSILVTKSKAQFNDTLNHYKDEYSEDILKKLEDVDELVALLRATIKGLVYPSNISWRFSVMQLIGGEQRKIM
ncbi:hypothetical protein BC332_19006 [Capsicum chinense]|nr:hypothetical protein BC332_19006 [Capsicum chinense]